MKRVILITICIWTVIIGAIFIWSGSDKAPRPLDTTEFSYYKVPNDIPDTLYSGKKVKWDSTWEDAYREGKVHIVWKDGDSTKGAFALLKIVKIKPWMRSEKYN